MRVRPNPQFTKVWNDRFIAVADLVASWSKDESTKVGAVIVRPDRTICSTGYNGFARSVSDAAELYADREVKLSRIIHAELNAILTAPEPVTGYRMYITRPPCAHCAAAIIQAGIGYVIFRNGDAAFSERWAESIRASLQMFSEGYVMWESI